MTRHTWTYSIGAPLVFVSIVAIAWYAFALRPQAIVSVPQAHSASATPLHPTPTAQSDQQPIADVAPTVNKLGGTLEFSVNSTSWKQVQKVEFYVETKLVGAVFAPPYAVRLDQNDLTAGTHTVTAKVYTSGSTAQTTPTLFTTNSTTPQSADSDDERAPVAAPAKPQAPTTLSAPTGLVAAAADDGTSASLSWKAVTGATSYQVWRDGAVIGTVAALTYTDTGLSPGQTYDYYIIAVSGDGTNSASSMQVAVTMPVPQPSGQDPVNVIPPTPPPLVTAPDDTTTHTAGTST